MEKLTDEDESQCLQNISILVVEAHQTTGVLLKDLLEYYGACVYVVECIEQALTLAASTAIDLFVVDIRSSSRDDNEFIRQLRQWESKYRQLPKNALALTDEMTLSPRQKVIAEYFTTYVAEPFTPMELLEKILELLDKQFLEPKLIQ